MSVLIKEIEEKIINGNIKQSDICALFNGITDDDLLLELKKIIDKSSLINKYLGTFLSDKNFYSEEEIKSKYDFNFGNILFLYAILKDKIAMDNLNFSYDDLKNLSSTNLFFNDMAKMEILPKEVTNDYAVKFQEYYKKYEDADSLEEKEKYKKKYVFYQNQIIEGNIRLIAFIAKRKVNHGLDMLELINEGAEGVIKALKKYNSSYGAAFTSYAAYWISSAMDVAIRKKGRVIKIPAEQYRFYLKYLDAEGKLTSTLCREPSLEEVAQYLNVDISRLEDLLNAFKEVASLDFKLVNDFDEEEKSVLNVVESGEFEGEFLNNDLLNHLISCLDEDEKKIIIYYFEYGYSLEKIGELFNLSREGARKRLQKILLKMKRFNNVRKVSFFDFFHIPKDEVLRIIENNNYMKSLARIFGNDLEKKVASSLALSDEVNEIVANINRIYEYSLGITIKKSKSDTKYIGYTLNEIINEYPIGFAGYEMTQQKIRILWERMNKRTRQYKLMTKAFGEDGLGKCNYSGISRDERNYVNAIITRWKVSKNNINLDKNILKMLGISKYENDKADKELEQELMKCLSELENKIILYHYTYNRDFKVIAEMLNIKENEVIDLENKALLKMKQYYKDNFVTLISFIDIPYKAIVSCINDLEDEERNYLYKLFGISLRESARKELVDEERLKVIAERLKELECARLTKIQELKYNNRTLYEIIGVSKEEMQVIVEGLYKKTKCYLVLKIFFGDDLLQVYNGEKASVLEKKKLYGYIKSMKEKYTAENELYRKSLGDILGFDVSGNEDLKNNCLLVKAFGRKLDQPYLNVLNASEYKKLLQVIDGLKNTVKNNESNEEKNTKENILIVSDDEFLNFINSLSDDIKRPFLLYFGLNDGVSYCVEDISLMLDINVSAVIIKLKKALLLLNAYKETFAKEFLEKNAMKLKRIS